MVHDPTATGIQSLAAWVHDLAFEDVPASVVETSKLLILDTLGVAMAATTDPVGEAILRWAEDFGAAGDVAALGSRRRYSPADAAMINGTLAHALDFDDHNFGGHASSVVLPAVLAIAENAALDGRQVLTAYIAGMEAFGRLAACMPTPHIHEYGFHPTAVLGLVAAACGAAKAAGVSTDLTAEAIAVSYLAGAGLTASFGTTVKPMHVGNTAASGVRAVQLARSGFTGNKRLFEDRHGFGHAYIRNEADWAKFVESLAGPFRLEVKHPSIKQWPCCGGNQRSIQNLSRIMLDNHLDEKDIEKVEVHINPKQLTTLRYSWPENAYQGKFCLPFAVTCTLAKGGPTLAAYRDAYWDSEDVLSARERVEIIADIDGEEKHELEVRVYTNDGRKLSGSNMVVHGSARDPMTREEVSAKYFDCASYGTARPNAVAELHAVVLAIDSSGQQLWKAMDALSRAQLNNTSQLTGVDLD